MADYFGAGIIPYYIDDKTDKIKILLLHETRIDTLTKEIQANAYIDLGGKKEYLDSDAAFTAVREMNEESGGLYQEQSGIILDSIRSGRCLTLALLEKKPYYFFFVKLEFKPSSTPNLEWIFLLDLLQAKDHELNGYMISNRLIKMLDIKEAKKKLIEEL